MGMSHTETSRWLAPKWDPEAKCLRWDLEDGVPGVANLQKKTIYEQQGHIRNFYRRPVASSGHRVRVHELKQK